MRWMQTAHITAMIQIVLVGMAFGPLAWSFVVGD
jgi:hypothetical protein